MRKLIIKICPWCILRELARKAKLIQILDAECCPERCSSLFSLGDFYVLNLNVCIIGVSCTLFSQWLSDDSWRNLCLRLLQHFNNTLQIVLVLFSSTSGSQFQWGPCQFLRVSSKLLCYPSAEIMVLPGGGRKKMSISIF